jgi:hypothetical protein
MTSAVPFRPPAALQHLLLYSSAWLMRQTVGWEVLEGDEPGL